MTSALLGLVPIGALAVCVFCHVLAARARPGGSRLAFVAAGFSAGLATVAASAGSTLSWLAAGSGSGVIGAWLTAYLCLVYCYFAGFYNTGESARRIRLVRELLEAGERGLTRGELASRYNARMIAEARLSRMMAGGQIVEQGGRLHTGKPVMLLCSRLFVLFKRLYLGAPSEFGPKNP